MTVEVKVIAEGISGISKKKSIPKRKNTVASSSSAEHSEGAYQAAAKRTASRMHADNAMECVRITDKKIKAILRAQLRGGDPNLTVQDLDNLVNELLPIAMLAYRGPAVLKPDISPEVKAVWKARKAERQRMVKANKLRRKMS
jgi:hypothetical protein